MRRSRLPWFRAATVGVLAGALAAGTALPATASTSEPGLPSPRFVEQVEPLAEHQPQQTCLGEEQPGVASFRDLVLSVHPDTRDGGVLRACHIGGRSEHKEGRGWDWMVDATDPQQKAAAAEVLAWLLRTDPQGVRHGNARRMGLMYVIWNRQIWSASRAGDGWRPYHGPNPHVDHVHFSFTWEGARAETSWWTSAREDGPALRPQAPDPAPAAERIHSVFERPFAEVVATLQEPRVFLG